MAVAEDCPKRGINDAHVTWQVVSGQLTELVWSKRGDLGETIPAPPGANGWRLIDARVGGFAWTRDGQDMPDAPEVPKGTVGLSYQAVYPSPASTTTEASGTWLAILMLGVLLPVGLLRVVRRRRGSDPA